MKIIISTITWLLFVIASCTSASKRCKIITTDDNRNSVYSCVRATFDDVLDVPDDVEWLQFSISKFPQLPDKAFSRLALRGLSFYNCDIGHIHPNAFEGLRSLEQLTFYRSNIHVLKTSWFETLNSLTHLFLNRNDMVYIEPNVFSLIPKLQYLNIEDNNLNCISTKVLDSLGTLEHVRLGKNPWLCSCYAELLEWMNGRGINYGLRNLIRERLECMIEDVDAVTEYSLPIYKTFRNISVSENGYIEMSLAKSVRCVGKNLAALHQMPDNAIAISFTDSQIYKLPGYAFFRFGNSLRSLFLTNCSISEIHPEAFVGLSRLKILYIINNSITTVKSEWFKDLHSLEYLVLSGNAIKYIEPSAFLLLSKLKYLTLINNRIQCMSPYAFDPLKRLTEVVLLYNPWMCECQEGLRKRLHEKRISYTVSRGPCVGGYVQDSDDLFDQTFERREVKVKGQKTGLAKGSEVTLKVDGRNWMNKQTPEVTEEEVVHNRNIEISNYEYYRLRAEEDLDDALVLEGTDLKRTSAANEMTAEVDEEKEWHITVDPSENSYNFLWSTIWVASSIPADAEIIRFKRNNIQTIFTGIFARFGENLRVLEFKECPIQDIEPQAFDGLVNLETLALSYSNIHVVRSAWFENIPNLRKLNLTQSPISEISPGVFEILRNLEELDISHNKLNCIDMNGLSRLKKLNKIHIHGNPWSCLCLRTLNEWLDEQRIQYDTDFSLEEILWNCTKEYPNLKTASDHDTNSIDSMSPYAEEKMPETMRVENVRSFEKTQEETSTLVGNLKIIQVDDNSADLTVIEQTINENVSTPPTVELYTGVPEGRCSLVHMWQRRLPVWVCKGGDIQILEQIPSDAERICITTSDISVVPANAFVRFSNLTDLVFETINVSDAHPLAFAGLNKLRRLMFVYTNLTTVRSSWFHNLSNLRQLELPYNSILEIEPDVFEYLPNLITLSIGGNKLRCIYTNSLLSSKHLSIVTIQENPWKWRCHEELINFLYARNIIYEISGTTEGKRAITNFLASNNFASK
ncbi:slit homolog 3 protein-like [Diprion similis]|uniref:slit homolog 3 protein-like n=1 Tax=Diprion similis TaxID=362088 RepID=UPI001EF906A7|nr:slit homolog 3 protein-like [Diprion similis]